MTASVSEFKEFLVAFSLEDVTAFELADFAQRCGIDRQLLKREARRLAKLAADRPCG